MIAKPKKSDISVIADLHMLSLPNELLSKLGRKFLTEIYSVALSDNDSYFIASKTGRNIQGFIFLSKNSGRFYKRLVTRRFFKLAFIIFEELIQDISLLGKLASTAKYLLFSNAESIPEILVLSVHPNMQRSGIGSALLKTLEDKLADDGLSVYNVKTTSLNKKSNRFYTKNDFKVIKRFKIQQRGWVEYRKKI